MENEIVDVEAIDIHLIGSKDEIAKGLMLIDRYFKGKIIEIIRKRALSAKEHDLYDIYQEVLLGVFEKARTGKYDPGSCSLKSLLYSIASKKAITWVRDKTAQKRKSPGNDILIDSVAEIIKDSNVHEPWQDAQRNEERAKILTTIQNLVPKLKHRQRQVAEIIIENFPDPLEIPDIKEQILNNYNEDITAIAVKRARQELYNKVTDALIIAGYGEWADDK